MASLTGQEIITIHVLPNTSKSKGNQIMKFGPLVKYNTTSIFLEKSYKQCDGQTSSRPFHKKIKIEHILFKNNQNCFLFHVKSSFRS